MPQKTRGFGCTKSMQAPVQSRRAGICTKSAREAGFEPQAQNLGGFQPPQRALSRPRFPRAEHFRKCPSLFPRHISLPFIFCSLQANRHILLLQFRSKLMVWRMFYTRQHFLANFSTKKRMSGLFSFFSFYCFEAGYSSKCFY